MTTLLSVSALDAFYGDFQALFGIDFELEQGEAVAVIGANGAGKSTFLKSLAGLVRNRPDAIRLAGREIGDSAAAKVVRLGLALVPEGRQLFPSLSVEENLLIGAYGGDRTSPWDLQSVYRMFPVLQERRRSTVTVLSGGQQQMVAIGRALMSNPSVLLCDEISLGLAPIVVEDIYRMLQKHSRQRHRHHCRRAGYRARVAKYRPLLLSAGRPGNARRSAGGCGSAGDPLSLFRDVRQQ